MPEEWIDEDREHAMARDHYEPPGFRLMMEVLKLLGNYGRVTMTVTVHVPPASEDEPQ